MKAINLIPGDARRGTRASASSLARPAYAILAGLALAVLLVTVYVLTSNTISERKAKVAELQGQVTQAQAQAARLSNYTQFAKLAQTRVQTVREIAASRFDWHGALSELSRVVPANTSLQSLLGTVVPGASAGGASGSAGSSGGSAGSLRGDISAPAFELSGCTATQDDVARLMSRLRVMNGVTRVTLSSTAKSGASTSSTSGSGATGCGANGAAFDLVVFFTPVPGAGPTGIASVTSQPVSTTTGTGGSQ